ncbi:DB module [Oesophagostomum dentatum]|uniref:DB module n=1 Tax=Oesophagostomum dentatum TaxID=61180 RepID=A0A0B1TRP8_OESDE|nr:DB module [Oesophagostomum dentatum]
MLLLLLLISPAIAQPQWNWNPFAAFQQPAAQQQLSRPVAHAAPQQQSAQARTQAIYGIPGQRNANQKLRTCCRKLKNADLECRRRFCDFNALRPEMWLNVDHTLVQVIGFMAQCAPRGPTVGQMWDCASSRVDHTPCCRRQGVIDQCLAYCETTHGVPTDYLKYIVCLSQFDKIRHCFKEYLQHNPNIDGDF